jgi:hypothetical protein
MMPVNCVLLVVLSSLQRYWPLTASSTVASTMALVLLYRHCLGRFPMNAVWRRRIGGSADQAASGASFLAAEISPYHLNPFAMKSAHTLFTDVLSPVTVRDYTTDPHLDLWYAPSSRV